MDTVARIIAVVPYIWSYRKNCRTNFYSSRNMNVRVSLEAGNVEDLASWNSSGSFSPKQEQQWQIVTSFTSVDANFYGDCKGSHLNLPYSNRIEQLGKCTTLTTAPRSMLPQKARHYMFSMRQLTCYISCRHSADAGDDCRAVPVIVAWND